MREALEGLPLPTDPNVLIGHLGADDAGVYRIDGETALVLTTDFFQPIVDDPVDFGRVAAANSMSDVYAMGGRPVAALNIAAFPEGEFPNHVLREILQGGAEVASEAGASIIGGHTINDKELKYGLAVAGLVHPDRIVTNGGARPGDRLLLTKPLGSGILSTALRADRLGTREAGEFVKIMTQLNRDASLRMVEHGVHACTDITGFGLLGHALELAIASGVTCEISPVDVPFMTGAMDFAKQGMLTGGGQANRKFVEGNISFRSHLDETIEHILYDPQTSGGLLIAVPEETCFALLEALRPTYPFCAVIGRVREKGKTNLVI